MNKQLKLGIVVLLTVAAAIWGMQYLKGYNLLKDDLVYHARYKHIQGLVEANPVQFQGFKVGQVSTIKIVTDTATGESYVDVSFMITDENIKITDSTIARIISSDLLGARAINIEQNNKGKELPNGSLVQGSVQQELTEMINAELQPLKNSVAKLIESAEQLVGSFGTVMNDDTKNSLLDAFERIPHAIRNLEKATQTIDTTIGESQSKIRIILANVESISENFKNNNSKISAILSNLNGVTDSLAKSNLKQTILDVSTTLSNTNVILEKINKGEGTMGLLLNDKKLYNELTTTAARLNILIRDINTNPQKYINMSLLDFRRNTGNFDPDSGTVKEQIKQDSLIMKD